MKKLVIFIAIAALLFAACDDGNTGGGDDSGDPDTPSNGGNQTPVANDYIFGNLNQTAGSVTAVTITAKSGKSPGTITIYYDGSTAIPQTAGTYAVTFEVAAAAGWDAASGLFAGNLVVAPDEQPGTRVGRIAYSTDGIHWTAVTGITFRPISNVAWGNNTWVASDYFFFDDGNVGNIASSPDGIHWTIAAENMFNGDGINGIAYGNGTFVMVGGLNGQRGGKNRIAYSADARTWTEVDATTLFGNDLSILSVGWGSGKFIAHGFSRMAYSTDGIIWTRGTPASSSIECIAWGNDTWVAPQSWSSIRYSTDNGSSWRSTWESYSANAIFDIVWGGPAGDRKFVAVGSRPKIAYSPDGITWTAAPPFSTNNSNVLASVGWGGDKFVAGGERGEMAYSSDGTTWTAVPDSTFGSNGVIRSIAYGNGIWVAVGNN